MVVDAEVWYWTPQGMRKDSGASTSSTRYVTVRDVERLLEEAHARGVRAAEAKLVAARQALADDLAKTYGRRERP